MMFGCRDDDPGPGATAITDAERQAAHALLATNTTFVELVGGEPWAVASVELDRGEGGKRLGLALVVELPAKVDSEGPWRATRCRGSVTYDFTFPYRGVSSVFAVFRDDGTRLTALRPFPTASLTFDDADVARQPALPACPPGMEDAEN